MKATTGMARYATNCTISSACRYHVASSAVYAAANGTKSSRRNQDTGTSGCIDSITFDAASEIRPWADDILTGAITGWVHQIVDQRKIQMQLHCSALHCFALQHILPFRFRHRCSAAKYPAG